MVGPRRFLRHLAVLHAGYFDIRHVAMCFPELCDEPVGVHILVDVRIRLPVDDVLGDMRHAFGLVQG